MSAQQQDRRTAIRQHKAKAEAIKLALTRREPKGPFAWKLMEVALRHQEIAAELEGIERRAVPSASAEGALSRASVKRKRTKQQNRRDGIVFGALQGGLKGIRYCKHLDANKISPSETWQSDGCPATYAGAYKEQQWRKRIQDQKHRFQVRYDSLSTAQREKLIQDATRSTR